jgi:hypothetical protein
MGLFFYFNQSSPLNNPEAYAKETNEWMTEKLAAQEAEKETADYEKKEKRYFANLTRAARKGEAALKDIDFYGRVIDQDNNPVAGVIITYDLGGLYLAPGTGFGEITTNEKGEFNIDDGRGLDIYFRNMSKPGYQYQFSNDGGTSVPFYTINNLEWDKTSKKNPYVFTLWRIDRYPEVVKSRGNIEAKPEEKDHTLDFMDRTKPLVLKGLQEGDLQITIDKAKLNENGIVKISALNGGLQETDDLYPFRAPANGYIPTVEYKLVYRSHFKDFDELFKKFYFTSRNGEVYGYVEMEVKPNWNDNYAVFLQYVVNKEKGRDLLVKE